MILWLHEQAESQQRLIQSLVCHRLPSVTLAMFLHPYFNGVPKELPGPTRCRHPCPGAAGLVLLGRLQQAGGAQL